MTYFGSVADKVQRKAGMVRHQDQVPGMLHALVFDGSEVLRQPCVAFEANGKLSGDRPVVAQFGVKHDVANVKGVFHVVHAFVLCHTEPMSHQVQPLEGLDTEGQ